jgi:membrane protein DedA with SNARE-associated domain
MSFPTVVLAAAMGGLLSDMIWYLGARARGRDILEAVCGLTSNPRACALNLEGRARGAGPIYIIFSKLLPGVGNMMAAVSGVGGIPILRFAILDTLSLTLWAGVYGGLGWFFFEEVEAAMAWIDGVGRAALVIGVGLVVAAGAWRVLKIRMHRPHHERLTRPSTSVGMGEDLLKAGRRNPRASGEEAVGMTAQAPSPAPATTSQSSS